MIDDVELLHLAPQPTAVVVIAGIRPAAVGAALAGALPDVFSHLTASGLAMIGPPFSRSH